jgi:aminoglycoside phosphotransferase (APT) family kinase protein
MVVERRSADPRAFVRLAERHWPSLPVRSARAIQSGWCCFVLDVSDEWILRFPRSGEDAARLEPELRLLPELERRLEVPVPHVERVVRDGDGRVLFVAYRKLKGRPLPRRNLTGARARAWATEITGVVRALERFPLRLGRRLGVEWSERTDRRGRWVALHPWVRERVQPLLPVAARNRDIAYWESYLRQERTLDLPPSLNHGDFGPEHILVNDRGIAGILDWESACYEDPVAILTGLPTADGFAARIARAAVAEEPGAVAQRIAFHRHASAAYAVVHGLDTRDAGRVAAGLARYVRTLPR